MWYTSRIFKFRNFYGQRKTARVCCTVSDDEWSYLLLHQYLQCNFPEREQEQIFLQASKNFGRSTWKMSIWMFYPGDYALYWEIFQKCLMDLMSLIIQLMRKIIDAAHTSHKRVIINFLIKPEILTTLFSMLRDRFIKTSC